FQGLLNVTESYRPETLLTMNLTLPDMQYAKPAPRLNFHQQIWQRLGSMPGVESAAMVSHVPYAEGGGIGEQDISIEGRAASQRGEIVSAIVQTATPNYFGVMNIALRDGRLLSDSDGPESQPVAVVSASLVRRYFAPGENPIGKKIKVGKTGGDS